VELCPPVTLVGFKLTPTIVPVDGPDGFTVSVVPKLLAEVAVMVALCTLPTEEVVTVKFTLDWPAAIVTLAGTAATPLLLERLTNTPPAAASEPSVTVPVELCPPVTLVGFKLTPAIAPVDGPDGAGGFKVSDALTLLAEVAMMVGDCALPTGDVVTAKLADDCPAAIVTLAGTEAEP
jgi:hypothetical protein